VKRRRYWVTGIECCEHCIVRHTWLKARILYIKRVRVLGFSARLRLRAGIGRRISNAQAVALRKSIIANITQDVPAVTIEDLVSSSLEWATKSQHETCPDFGLKMI